jgi:hypothetical protein
MLGRGNMVRKKGSLKTETGGDACIVRRNAPVFKCTLKQNLIPSHIKLKFKNYLFKRFPLNAIFKFRKVEAAIKESQREIPKSKEIRNLINSFDPARDCPRDSFPQISLNENSPKHLGSNINFLFLF